MGSEPHKCIGIWNRYLVQPGTVIGGGGLDTQTIEYLENDTIASMAGEFEDQ